ncbi:copper oxidase [Rhizobium sp. Root274]|uniref:multicopper oxidase family protein n=1 Tax=unclassified Rhizobium TaxID=2613769 RepID=UPI0007144ED6|nr:MULTISPECIES: multicopper oxidase family protein [unclassified Rhizobium]KQW32249.1 copper oxidase [Rhizobium sp. Root1240]KRD33791.1 copper oxidase [Rhizobium sp. Root274]
MFQLSRRTLLKSAAVAGAYGAGVAVLPRLSQAFAAPSQLDIEARMIDATLDGQAATHKVMSYGLTGAPSADPSPPVLRMQRGKPFAATLTNTLDEPTTIHWHGLRIPNAQDGVPFVTQPYVYPGDRFDYAFTPPDAGTFWYHPHCNTLTQMGRGLTGMLVVEDDSDPVFDGEVTLNLRDFRLGSDSQFIAQFKPRDAAKTGTFGTVRTANWQPQPVYDVPAGGLVRLRILASDVTRIYNLKLEGAEAMIIAVDGHPVPARFVLDMAVVAPGQRLDLALRVPDSEGALVSLEDIRPSTPKVVTQFRAVGASLKRHLGDLGPLAENAGVEVDLKNATQVPLLLSATAENAAKDSICGTLGYSFWAINKVPYPGDTADPTAPIAELKLGQSYILNVENVTPHAHPIHLHGMNFKAVDSNKQVVQQQVSDTYLVLPDEKVQLALVADNPGDWVFHCHIIEHQKTGMTGYFRVT